MSRPAWDPEQSDQTGPSRPLEGIRVLDLTQFLSGPFCTMILADLGADVIKIEPPGGEPQRHAMKVSAGDDDSPSFMALNRNKRSMAIDLAADGGRELLYELAAEADILVENFRPGVTSKLGIDYEQLRAIQPRLIYASITGFGDRGPYADRPGLDLIAQAMSGLMSITGHPGQDPAKVGVPVTDLTAGMFCAIGILSAHVARSVTGEGRRVGASLFGAGLSLAIHESMDYWARGVVPEPLGSSHRLAAPYQALRTRDSFLTVGAGTEKLWRRLCEAIGREDLPKDERFATNARRMEHRAELQTELESTLATAPTEEWVPKIISAGVPAGPIMNYRQVLDDPHTCATGMVLSMDHPRAGTVRALGTPISLSDQPAPAPRPAPMLAEHTDEILREFGFADERIAALRHSGVL